MFGFLKKKPKSLDQMEMRALSKTMVKACSQLPDYGCQIMTNDSIFDEWFGEFQTEIEALIPLQSLEDQGLAIREKVLNLTEIICLQLYVLNSEPSDERLKKIEKLAEGFGTDTAENNLLVLNQYYNATIMGLIGIAGDIEGRDQAVKWFLHYKNATDSWIGLLADNMLSEESNSVDAILMQFADNSIRQSLRSEILSIRK